MKSALLLLPLLALAAPASAKAPKAAAPTANLLGLFSGDDYPQDAADRGEQGSVEMRLHVGTDGRVKRCEIAESSESESLDSKSCEIMIERARFTPARDRRGRATEGVFVQRVHWRMTDGPQDPVLNAATSQWMTCVANEAESRIATGWTAEVIAEAAYAACLPLLANLSAAAEASTIEGVTFADLMRSLKETTLREIRALIEQAQAPK